MGPDLLLLRLEGPLMSFGGVKVDGLAPTEDFPQTSMLVGLLANALGIERRDPAALDRLQGAIRYAVRRDRPGRECVDYQTVDLSDPAVSEAGWTTRGEVECRGGASGDGTHVRHVAFLADASYLVALRLEAGDGVPGLDDVQGALDEPCRPLFLGRKAYLPSTPIFERRVAAGTLFAALEAAPLSARNAKAAAGRPLRAWWPDGEGPSGGESVVAYDRRSHALGVHVGRRFLRTGFVAPRGAQ